MRILIIGGSYFLGKRFMEIAAISHDVSIINRGSRPLNKSNITEYVMGRRDSFKISGIPDRHFDVIVDFCDIRVLRRYTCFNN